MPESQESSDRSGVSPRLIAAVAIVALLVVFIIQNTRKTRIRFLIPNIDAPLWVALFVSMLLGGAVGALIARNRKN